MGDVLQGVGDVAEFAIAPDRFFDRRKQKAADEQQAVQQQQFADAIGQITGKPIEGLGQFKPNLALQLANLQNRQQQRVQKTAKAQDKAAKRKRKTSDKAFKTNISSFIKSREATIPDEVKSFRDIRDKFAAVYTPSSPQGFGNISTRIATKGSDATVKNLMQEVQNYAVELGRQPTPEEFNQFIRSPDLLNRQFGPGVGAQVSATEGDLELYRELRKVRPTLTDENAKFANWVEQNPDSPKVISVMQKILGR